MDATDKRTIRTTLIVLATIAAVLIACCGLYGACVLAWPRVKDGFNSAPRLM